VPSTTWTPHAVASELFRLRRRLWRAVETQHIASTLRLVATAQEQDTLELILEASKPPVPAEAARLHYLLATPFRYPSPFGSRFRAPTEPGVWYGTEVLRSACAELGYWRWRFLMDSEALETLGPSPQTVFQASIDTRAVDLTRAPFRRDQARWGHRSDYGPTQQFAALAREAEAGAIRYVSVRDPEHAAAVAVLRADAFKPLRPIQQVSWFLTLKPERVIWRREGESFEFDAAAWN